jgi:hypothetical protein
MSRARRLRQRSGVRSRLTPAVAAVRSGWIEKLEQRCLLSAAAATPALIAKDFSAVEGAAFNGQIATLTGTNGADTASNFTAAVNWGDGTVTSGTVAAEEVPLSLSGFNQDVVFEAGAGPSVSHDFDDSGFAWFQAGATDTANVTHSDGLPTSFTSKLGTPFQFQSFTVNNVLLLDSSGPTSGSLALTTPGRFGSLAILASSTTGDGGSTGSVTVHYTDATTDTFSYNAPDWISTGAASAALPSNVARSIVGAGNTFAGIDSASNDSWQMFETNIHPNASKQIASLSFGTAGPFTTGIFAVTGTDFAVSGAHTYADEGNFNTNVTVSGVAGPDAPFAASASGTASVAEGDFGSLFATTITAIEGNSFTGAVGSFSDEGNPLQSASDWTASIDWGDGTTTAGTVSGSTGGPFTISGTHTYPEEGTYSLTPQFSDDSPSILSAQIFSTAIVSEASLGLTAGPSITAVEGTPANNLVLATFQDPGSTDPASDFTATVDWGDGITTAGTVSGTNGNYTVTGSHTYADEMSSGFYLVTVAEPEANLNIGPVSAAVTVSEGDVFGPVLVTSGNVVEHQLFGGEAAVFSDSYAGQVAADLSGTFDWGDGTTFSTADGNASLTKGGDGNFTLSVSGHSYADEGTYTVKATISDDAPGTASLTQVGTLVAAENDVLSGAGLSISVIEQTAFSGNVATFTDTDKTSPASDFIGTIDWGDGTTTAGTVSGVTGAFTVSGSHPYAEDGSYVTKIILSDDAPGTATATAAGAATVLEGVLAMASSPGTITGVEGVAFSGLLATASDPGSPDPASDFSATIDWGDGSTTAGTVSGSNGNYSISGSHVITEEGNYSATITFFENNDPAFTISVGKPISITDAPLSSSGTTILTTEGLTFNNKVVAHFTDANPNPDVLDFSANINWGDGTSSVGTIADNGSGGFDVSGSHQYLEQAANLPVTVTIKDIGGSSTIAHSAASIADAAITPTAGQIVNATEGLQLTGVVLGGFIDADPNGQPSDYTVTINWGDGSPTTAGLVTANGPGFDVSGTHTYADEGMYLPIITINDEGGFANGGFTATLNAKVLVGDAALTATGTPVSAVEGQSGTVQVASFTDANPAAPLSDFGALINWGDGTPATAGAITQPGGVGTPFIVTGTHTYGEEGIFTVTTSIKDVGGSTATATSTATVADAPLTVNPATLPFLIEGASFSGPIATLFDADPAGTQSDYTVTVNWGDGTSSAGTVGRSSPAHNSRSTARTPSRRKASSTC